MKKFKAKNITKKFREKHGESAFEWQSLHISANGRQRHIHKALPGSGRILKSAATIERSWGITNLNQ